MSADTEDALTVRAGASGILLGTVAVPGVDNRTLGEGYLTQPLVSAMVSTRGGSFTSAVMLDLEGLTLKRGELNAGIYGEGYVDRRHPHTVLHEVTATALLAGRKGRASITAGKGFVAFGTDDPMSRPLVKYPMNHHLAQILERALVIGALEAGPITLDASLFNGDEPESTSDMPNWSRFGDSWSGRVTARYPQDWETQVSYAKVSSPEQPHGGGLDQRKTSASARYESARNYLLAEWARTRELDHGATAFTFRSLLVEGSTLVGRVTFGGRAERSERPEEERLVNAFRTPRPHSDLAILGRTRWTILTANASAALPLRGTLVTAPFVEISTQAPRSIVTPSAFDPESFYGSRRLWSFSAGARIGIGMRHSRMGRYGAAAARTAVMNMPDMEMM